LRIIKEPYVYGSPHGFAYMELNVITLVSFASYETLAHELGHIVDAQTRRKGHSFFIDKKDLPIEEFANAVKRVILKECQSVKQ